MTIILIGTFDCIFEPDGHPLTGNDACVDGDDNSRVNHRNKVHGRKARIRGLSLKDDLVQESRPSRGHRDALDAQGRCWYPVEAHSGAKVGTITDDQRTRCQRNFSDKPLGSLASG
jgi:hypothetical protein